MNKKLFSVYNTGLAGRFCRILTPTENIMFSTKKFLRFLFVLVSFCIFNLFVSVLHLQFIQCTFTLQQYIFRFFINKFTIILTFQSIWIYIFYNSHTTFHASNALYPMPTTELTYWGKSCGIYFTRLSSKL